MLLRAVSGLLVAAAIALLARRAGSLSTSGALAATAIGGAAVAAGWRWGALLVLYFVVMTGLSRLGAAEKSRRTMGIVAKAGRRDAMQVIANGGVFALSALLVPFAGYPVSATLSIAALGALAASAADTAATEIGTLYGGTPHSFLTLEPVPPGTSGGVSLAGSLAMIGGAFFIALAAHVLSLTGAVFAVALGGTAGAMADSLIGASFQERRWCPTCHRATERAVHDCGSITTVAGGLRGLDNDVVNLVATLIGGAVAAALSNA